ncbi:MAG: hypothetical protein RLZZ546_1350 [Bacteroidota bacterium]|jgi:predicted GNAT family N-acyltransferase
MGYKIAEIEYGTPEYDETVKLRTDILRKPLGLEFTEEQLSSEFSDFHIALYDSEDALVACLILSPIDNNTIKMRQVAVETESQRKGIGKMLVHFSEELCKYKNYEKIILNARDTAVAFYESMAYHKDETSFIEVGITHYFMWKNII